MKLNIKVEIISLLLATMQNGKLLLHFSRHLVAARRHLSVNSPNHHTQGSKSIISVFLTNCSMSMVRGLALPYNSIKRHSISGRVSEYTWNNNQKHNRITPQNVYL